MDELSNEPIETNEPAPFSPPPSSGEDKPGWLTRKEYTDPAEKKRDFWLGFGLWWGLNIALGVCQWIISMAFAAVTTAGDYSVGASETLSTVLAVILYILPWVINIGLIIYFAFTRSYMALGMLAGFGSVLALAICLGLIVTAACFVIISSMGY